MRITRGICLAIALSFGGAASAEDPIHATMYKMPYCDCCEGHAEHLRQNGIEVEINVVDDLAPVRQEHAVPTELEGCHTILIDGLVVEGHVSADIVKRLLAERPEGVAGIAIPGMPLGVPGMPGEPDGPIEVFAFGQGETSVFAQE